MESRHAESVSVLRPSFQETPAPPATDPDARITRRELKQLLQDGGRPLNAWEQYRALNDAMDEVYEVIGISNREARFAGNWANERSDAPIGIRYYEDVIARDVQAHRQTWQEVELDQLNSELAIQHHSLCLKSNVKRAALEELQCERTPAEPSWNLRGTVVQNRRAEPSYRPSCRAPVENPCSTAVLTPP